MKTQARNLLLLLILLSGLCAADRIGLFSGIDGRLYDISFRARGKRQVSERIVIAAIDEKTLAAFGKWPIPRSVYGNLLSRLEGAAAVGFDVVLSEPSPDDAPVALAVKRHRRVVLPVYLDRALNVTLPIPTLSFAATGHVHVEQGVDHVAREVFHTIAVNGWQIPSLSSAMYRMATEAPAIPAMPAVIPAARPVHQMDLHRINFYGPPGTFPQLSVADIVAGRYPPELFKQKIVLVGLTAPGIIDEVATPFSQDRNWMTGVELHANILNNLLDDNRMKVAPDWLRFAAATLLTLLIWSLSVKVSETKAFVASAVALLLLSAGCFSLFAAANLWVAPSLLYASIALSFTFCHLWQLDETARRLDSEHRTIAALIEGESATHAEATGGGLLTMLTREGINRNIDRLIELQKTYAENLQAAVTSRTRELEEALSTIACMSDEMVLRLAWAVESKDKDTSEHTFRLGLYARVIAEELGLPAEFIDNIAFASALHDVGKIGIPDHILLKKGPLNMEEMEVIKTHCLIGKRILDNSSFPKIRMCASIALNHHERWDGTGYPNGLKGDDIPLEARIIAVCDCYDSLRSSRPYKEAYDHETALRIMLEGNSRTSPEHFDPVVLQAFRKTAAILAEIFRDHQD